MKKALMIVSLAGILTARAQDLPETASVWIEAEEPSAGNFPPTSQNPFAPKEFWEEAVLSGGKWIGMKWKEPDGKQPYLEYIFNVPSRTNYHLYARKLYTYGNFRWQIDGGPWQSVPDEIHTPLDFVVMREEPGDRIALNWFAMGVIPLEPGRHTLRIEPAFKARAREPDESGDYAPLGYDAFFITPEPFLPNGSDKPARKTLVQTSDSFAPGREVDPFQDCPIDWRGLNEKYAGESGGIVVRGGRLAFRDSGEPVRLFGVNVTMRAFGDPSALAHFARLLAKLGVNLVRIDLAPIFRLEGSREAPRFSIVPSRMGLLTSAVERFRAEGIYTALTWHVANTEGAPARYFNIDGVLPRSGNATSSGISAALVFDPSLQSAVRQAWKQVLATPLPGGTVLGKDPCLAILTLSQQETIFQRGSMEITATQPGLRIAMEERFAKWLSRKGERLSDILAGWPGEPLDGDRPDEGRIGMLSPEEVALWKDARARKTADFLAEAQRDYYSGLIRFLREDAGFCGLLATTNRGAADAAALGWINAWSANVGDIQERQATFAAPFQGIRDVWLADPGSLFSDRSAISLDKPEAGGPGRFELPLRCFTYKGKATFLGEVSWPLPNRYRPEMVMLATAFAQVQGVDAIALTMLEYSNWQGSLSASRLSLFTPGVMGQFPAFAYAYRKGLLPGGSAGSRILISGEELFAISPAGVVENSDVQAHLPPPSPSNPGQTAGESLFWINGPTVVELDASKTSAKIAETEMAGPQAVLAASGQIRWNFGEGLILLDAPMVKAAGGNLGQAGEIVLGPLRVASPMEFGIFCAVSIDGLPLAESGKILFQVFSEESNAGTFAEGAPMKTLLSTGRPPIMVKNLRGGVTIDRPDAQDFVVTALDSNGYKKLVVAAGGTFQWLPSTQYYLIEK